MKKLYIYMIATVLAISMLCGCTNNYSNVSDTLESDTAEIEDESQTKEIFAMDTYMTLTAYGKGAGKALTDAEDEIKSIDNLLSTGNEDSEIYKLNESGEGELSDTAGYLLKRSLEINKETDGAFDPAIYPIMELWGFPTKDFKVPTQSEIDKTLPLTNIENIDFNEENNKVKFKKVGVEIDFGGIAKGYTSAQVIDIFKNDGITSAVISLGGNVQVLGTKPNGSLWRVAIQNPDKNANYLGVLKTSDKAVITSGGYERYFERDGKIYHHIIDPKTGYPAESGLKSVTIVSDDGTMADGYSTSLFVMGLDKATDFWKENSDDFDAIFLTDDNKLYITEGIENNFSSDFDFDVIKKD